MKFKIPKAKGKVLDHFAKLAGLRERKSKKFLCFTLKESDKEYKKEVYNQYTIKGDQSKLRTKKGLQDYLSNYGIDSIIIDLFNYAENPSLDYLGIVKVFVLKKNKEKAEQLLANLDFSDIRFDVIEANL